MINEIEKDQCTGCTACMNICPKNAIIMMSDDEGFDYPVIQEKKCIGCGLCNETCPTLKQLEKKVEFEARVFASWNENEEIRINSTSGGVFSALATAFIKQNGFIAGAVYDNDFRIIHRISNKMEDMPSFRQSKYAQSELGQLFSEIRELLEQNNAVLFCGTPCQVAGLIAYLKKDYDKLVCCDFICRGVISPKVYKKYLYEYGEKKGLSIRKVQFKNKDIGWNQFCTKIIYQDGSYYRKDRYEDPYMKGYLQHNLYMRPSCYKCHYKKMPRLSDITLGDFWGIGNKAPELDDNKGTSVVIVNSDKGQALFNNAKESLFSVERSINEVIEGNECLLHAARMGECRDFFFNNIDKMTLAQLIYKVDKMSRHISLTEKLKRKFCNIH